MDAKPMPRCTGGTVRGKPCDDPAVGFVSVAGATTPKFRCDLHLGPVLSWAVRNAKEFEAFRFERIAP